MAEALLRDHLRRAGIQATVASRGLLPPGRPVPEPAQAALARRGLDVADYRSQLLTPADVRAAGIVIGMERRHLREAVLHEPSALERSYTFRDVIARAGGVGPRAGAPLDQWLTRLHGERSAGSLLGDGGPDEIPDPMGGSAADFEAVARELEDLVERLVWLAFDGPAPLGPPVEPVPPNRPVRAPSRSFGGFFRRDRGPLPAPREDFR
jgi:protein-tyrosine-phosphatase